MRSDYFDVNRFVDAELHTALLREFDKPGAPDLFTCRGDCRRTLPRNHRDVLGRRSISGPRAILCRRCQFQYERDRSAEYFADQRRARASWFAAGRCRCGAERVEGKQCCQTCADRNLAAVHRYRAKQQRNTT